MGTATIPSFTFNLPVLMNSVRLYSYSQKCVIPREQFPFKVPPGSLSFCTVNSSRHVCFLYPNDNKFEQNFCAIDKCVKLVDKASDSTIKTDDILTKVELIENSVATFRDLSIKIIVDDSVFRSFPDLDLSQLKRVAYMFLELYHLTTNSVIKFPGSGQSVGIDSIEVISGSADSAVAIIGVETDLQVDDVQFIGLASSFNRKELAGVEQILAQLENIKEECRMCERYSNWAAKPSFNTLIVGPTGSGKTLLCHNFIINNKCNSFGINCSDIIKSNPGGTEYELRQIFDHAKVFVNSCRPAGLTVILIENIELICPSETIASTDKAHVARISSQLLSLLDDLHTKNRGILVLGTTSNLELVDSAIRRPGRFENEILIHTPNENQRFKILNLLLHQEGWLQNVNNEEKLAAWIACRTPGFVGADLALLVNSIGRETRTFSIQNNSSDLYEFYKEYFRAGLKTIKPTSLRGTDVRVISSDQSFDHIGGMDGLKKSLSVSVLSALKNPEAFCRFGLQPPKGILLYGPPGCAKTMIAKCLANEAKMTFISTSGAEVYSPYVGNAEKFILEIFNTARKNAPCLIFFDELDALVGNRTTSSTSDVQTRVLSTLLMEMDGIGAKVQSATGSRSNPILIVGATNRPDVIDSALMRPGRFDRLIHVPAPDRNSRLQILKIYKDKMPFADDVNIEEIADRTENFSGADLCNLCNEAALRSLTRDFETISIIYEDFNYVLLEMMPSLTLSQIELFSNFEKQHICG